MEVKNFTRFFKRELVIYSFGDFKLGRPIAVMRILYALLFTAVWAGIIITVFGFHMNPYFVMFTFVPPVILGWRAGSPVWGGRNLFDFIKVNSTYLFSPRVFTDMKVPKIKNKKKFFVEHVYWVSRRRELQKLAELRDERVKSKNSKRGNK